MKLTDSAKGSAPPMATSLTVPFTANAPISLPGKKSGETTKPSVETASRPAGTFRIA
jgi:hypothetical protein